MIVDRADGNPFFARRWCASWCSAACSRAIKATTPVARTQPRSTVPATVQAAIEARIDRLTNPAKRTLNAASVIGARFGAELIAALGVDPSFDELLSAELVDQVRLRRTPNTPSVTL